MDQGPKETALLFSDAGVTQEDKLRKWLDAMEDAGYDREEAAQGLIRALHTPITVPLQTTGP